MDIQSYLLKADEEEILQTWYACGQVVVNKDTKYYSKGSIVRVDASDGDWLSSAPLHNTILYVAANYAVDNKNKFQIDWSVMGVDDINGIYTALEGVTVPYFVVLGAKWNSGLMPEKDFIPYSSENISIDSGDILISDDELETILTVIGFPFVMFNEAELAKNEILKYCIKPAMQRYFTFRPIIEEVPGNMVARGVEFLVPFPKDAYACIPYYSTPGGGRGGVSTGSPFAFYNEQVTMGGTGLGGGRFGKGIKYHGKQVPGYVGLGWQNGMLDQLAVNQGYMNFFRREKYTRKKIDGKLYAYGFSTIGGNLNFKWLKESKDWDDIKYEDLEPIARPMARIEVLRNFGLLRSFVKTDIAGQLDPTILLNMAETLETKVTSIINSVGLTGQLAIMRGGG